MTDLAFVCPQRSIAEMVEKPHSRSCQETQGEIEGDCVEGGLQSGRCLGTCLPMDDNTDFYAL